ncbi:hypothetical protein I7I48_04887 [Histoplasma ohiense]|nr:hypothetical protein I7I48_04887 [Histoplasma ohiense (nom. inval.)]
MYCIALVLGKRKLYSTYSTTRIPPVSMKSPLDKNESRHKPTVALSLSLMDHVLGTRRRTISIGLHWIAQWDAPKSNPTLKSCTRGHHSQSNQNLLYLSLY